MTEIAVKHVPKSTDSVRYYGLDALRARAMTLGFVLHAAWILGSGRSIQRRPDVPNEIELGNRD
jgi:hypothetical protein